MYKEIDYHIDKEILIDIFEGTDEFGINLLDYYKEATTRVPGLDKFAPVETIDKNTVKHHFPKNFFCDLKLPFEPISFRFVEYSNSDMFIHKDSKVKSRIGLVLKGHGDLVFYDKSKKEIARTDLTKWTVFSTQVLHGVERTPYRLSFQIGFSETFEEIVDAF